MKNTKKLPRVFLDTSVLLSGLNSPRGASSYILSLFKLKKIIIVISPEVILEAENVIKAKFPLLKIPFLDFLATRPQIVEKLTSLEIKAVYKLIFSEDTPVFGGAIKAKVDFLLTLDKKFQKLAQNKTHLKIVPPHEFLQEYHKMCS